MNNIKYDEPPRYLTHISGFYSHQKSKVNTANEIESRLKTMDYTFDKLEELGINEWFLNSQKRNEDKWHDISHYFEEGNVDKVMEIIKEFISSK